MWKSYLYIIDFSGKYLKALKKTNGHPVKVTNIRMIALIKWTQEPATKISRPDKISKDVANLSSLEALMLKPRDIA